MRTSSLDLPSAACHNCRRRRWKCDKSLPECRKCIHAGIECLGYGKLFVWNEGIASRGKMRGKSFGESNKSKKEGPAYQLVSTNLAVSSNPELDLCPKSDLSKKEDFKATLY